MGLKMKFGTKMTALLMAVSIGMTSAGCGRQSSAAPETIGSAAVGDNAGKQEEGMQEADGEQETAKEEMISKEEPVEKTGSSFEIAPADFKLTIADWDEEKNTEVSIGSLMICVPFGWKMEQRVSEAGIRQYILVDIHSECADEEMEAHREGYEHEIIITPYEITRMPEAAVALAAEIKMYFPVPVLQGIKGSGKTKEIEGCWMYGENRDAGEREYFIFSENKTGKKELFHVVEGSSDVTSYENEVESFSDFMDEDLVHRNNGKCLVKRENTSELECYYWLNEETDRPLFLVTQDASGEMAVYQQGDYQRTLSIQNAEEEYPGGQYFLIEDLNQDGYDDIVCKYWKFNPNYSSETEGYLWDEKSTSFVYTVGEQLLGKVVWEDWNWEEHLKGSQQIPKELIAYLSEPLLGSKEEMKDIMLPLVSDYELTIEEVKELAKENAEIKRELLTITCNQLGQGIWLKVDADNDGIEDIFLCEYLGGSLGSVYYYLFQGTKEGDYHLTSREEELKMEFAFINWEGKNYLAKTTWEFTKKLVDGIRLECYEDGRYQGGISLKITAREGIKARRIETSYLKEEQYSGLASSLYTLAGKYQPGTRLPYGTAEEEIEDEEYDRCSDIDNDGEPEKYYVPLWQTSNYYTVDHLNFVSEEEKIYEQVQDIMYENGITGTPINLWVDETDYGNVIYILYEEGLYDFHICGYILTETESRKILQVDCDVQTQVTCQDIN